MRLNENYGEDSYLEINLDKEWTINDKDLITKAGWSPFNGVRVKGCIERFIYKNECVYNRGLLTNLKSGQNANIYKNTISVNKDIIKNTDNVEENKNLFILDNENYELEKLNNVIDVSQFNRSNLRSLFRNSGILKQRIKKEGKLNILEGKVVGLYFDEPSSRTYGSF